MTFQQHSEHCEPQSGPGELETEIREHPRLLADSLRLSDTQQSCCRHCSAQVAKQTDSWIKSGGRESGSIWTNEVILAQQRDFQLVSQQRRVWQHQPSPRSSRQCYLHPSASK